MIDPVDVQSVIDRVTARLARRYWWITKDDLASEAWIVCNTTDVLSEATSPGAFYERLRGRLTASLETERKWREERIVDVEVVDVDDEANAYSRGACGDDAVAPISRGRAGVDETRDQVAGARSRLLDRLAGMTKDEFVAWADEALGRQWGKKRDLQTLLFGYEDEAEALWVKYATNKRKSGEGGIGGLSLVDREQPEETWRAYRRWPADRRAANLLGPRPPRDRKPEWEKLRTWVR